MVIYPNRVSSLLVHKELIANTEGKTDASVWFTDGWQAYERQLSNEIEQWIGKVWEQTEMTVRLAITVR